MTELTDIPMGTILEDWDEGRVRCLIIRGSTALCAYLGVPALHPLAGFEVSAIPLSVHGVDLNFALAGGMESPEDRAAGFHRPEGWYWYGWSYDLWCDRKIGEPEDRKPGGQLWEVEPVKREAKVAAAGFEKLMILAEELTARALGWRRAISDARGDETA